MNYHTLIGFFLFYLLTTSLQAQTSISKIDSLNNKKEYDSALSLIKDIDQSTLSEEDNINLITQKVIAFSGLKKINEAESIVEKIDEIIGSDLSISVNNLARINLAKAAMYGTKKEYNKEIYHLNQAAYEMDHEKIDPELSARVYFETAKYHRYSRNLDSTLLAAKIGRTFLSKIENDDARYEAEVLLGFEKAAIYKNISQNEKSIVELSKLLPLVESKKDTARLTRFNNTIAIRYFMSGNFGKSKYYMEKAVALYILKYGPNSKKTAGSYQNIAVVHAKLLNYDDANEYYKKAHAIFVANDGESSLDIARLHFNIGIVHLQKSEHNEAIEEFKKSLKLRKKLLPPNHSDIAHSEQVIGTSLLHLKEYEQSEKYFKSAMTIREKIGNFNDPEIIRIYNALAIINIEYGKSDQASQYVNKAFAGMGYDIDNPMHFEDLANPFMLSNPLETDIKIARNKYIESPSPELYNDAYSKIQVADSLMSFMKYYLDESSSRKIFRTKQKLLYDKAIGLFFAGHKKGGDQEAISKVFKYIETGNNAMIYEKIAEDNSSSELGMPTKLLDQKHAIEDSIAYYKNLLSDVDQQENPILLKKATDFKEEHFDLMADLEENYPLYFQSIYQYPIVALDDYQSILQDNEASISFYLGNEYSYGLVVESNQTSLHKLGESQTITELLTEYIASISDRSNTARQHELAGKLYSKLIVPLNLKDGKNLTIIADDLYGLVPFELLRESSNSPYLFERNQISYQYSATLRAKNKQSTPAKGKMLAMAPIFESTNDNQNPLFAAVYDDNDTYRSNMDELKESENELLAIKNLFSGNYFLRSEATETKFKELAPKSSVIHMATHGHVNHENPDKSRLYFFSDSLSADDGQLNAFEIMNLDLRNTQLVTLSACNTGVGAIQTGEGVASLGRAFAYAGCQNQLISLWPANDKSTTQLMSNYYTNLKEGQGKSTALKNAKLAYLSEAPEVLKHPYYWAGFVYYGSDSGLSISTGFSTMTILGLCGISILFVGFLLKSKMAQ